MDEPLKQEEKAAPDATEQYAQIQKVLADFLANTRRLQVEHEQKIRAILKEVDQKKAEALKESIKNIS